jgi:hypothetical protein
LAGDRMTIVCMTSIQQARHILMLHAELYSNPSPCKPIVFAYLCCLHLQLCLHEPLVGLSQGSTSSLLHSLREVTRLVIHVSR